MNSQFPKDAPIAPPNVNFLNFLVFDTKSCHFTYVLFMSEEDDAVTLDLFNSHLCINARAFVINARAHVLSRVRAFMTRVRASVHVSP